MGVKGKARRRKRVIARDGKESLSKGTNENERERERGEREGEIKFSKRDDCRNEIKKRRLILYLMRFRCFI